MYSTNQRRNEDGRRIGCAVSTVDENKRLRLSAPIAIVKKQKTKREGFLKRKSLACVRTCVRTASKPLTFARKAGTVNTQPGRQEGNRELKHVVRAEKPSCYQDGRQESQHAQVIGSLGLKMRIRHNGIVQWQDAEITHFMGLKMVIRRVDSGQSRQKNEFPGIVSDIVRGHGHQ